MSNPIVIHWFRQDLRLSDNPALVEAAHAGEVLPIYILDNENAGDLKMGGASRWFLHHALKALNKDLQGTLKVFSGDACDVLKKLTDKLNIKAVFWNRCYEPWRIQRDSKIKKMLLKQSIKAESFNGSLLWEPWENLKDDGNPYRVFTPFYKRGCLGSHVKPRSPLNKPRHLTLKKIKEYKTAIEDLKLLPKINWYETMEKTWQISETAAKNKLRYFLENGLSNYKEGRNFPAQNYVSQMSPYLHFGLISPNYVWYNAKDHGSGTNLEHFLSELGWREFSYSQLYHFPQLPKNNLQEKFNYFPWEKNKKFLQAWQKGQTGYPIVDAGMRELWQTGYMHNRVRMITGSFLVKNLLLHWHEGERWFFDTLVDADLASNSASWQWVAGCGADAAPYFRIFNPVTQGEKFDALGEYTLKYVPELANLPKKYLYKPFEAPSEVLEKAGIKLGETYPLPIINLKDSRAKALAAFKSLKT